MKDQNSYNLNGLRAVFWGMLLEIVSNVGASGMGAVRTKFSGEMLNYIGIGFSAVSILAFLMVIIGLSQVGKYSAHFRRSRNYYLWSLLLAVVAVGLAVVAVWFIDTDQDSSRTMLGTVGMIVGAMVLILLAGWLDILKIKQMMNGCAQIARQNDEKRYAGRCTRAWIYYMFFAVVTVVLLAILVVVAIRSLLTTADTTGGQINSIEDMAGGFEYFFYVAGGLAISCILLLISYLLVMGKVNGTLMRYHKVEIPLGVLEDEEEVPMPPVEKTESASADAGTKQLAPEVPEPPKTQEVPEPPAAPKTTEEVKSPVAEEEPSAPAKEASTEAAEPAETVDSAESKAPEDPVVPTPLKQGGKHAKPSVFAKQAPSKHTAPKKAQSKPMPLVDELAKELSLREKAAETKTIEMPKESPAEAAPEAPELFEEGMEPKGFDK
ncbi:hypothetical protein [Eubacterium sp. AB3007]|uniref:hypothetical protein n=1 Tax=Eubacterium sp. AB3007 TaxID=1392487 RepID=UPI0004865617|nr:hypothetical protein [Eubacterium sp. AB3007]